MSTPLWPTTTRGALVGAATIESDDEMLTDAAHGLVNGQQVTVANLSGGALNVLVVDAPYFVANATANTFQLRPSPGAPVMTFTVDGGCDVYLTAGLMDAQTLRDGMSGLVAVGNSSNRFTSRTGIFPMSTETQHITVSGLTWTSADMVVAVQHATGRIYLVPHPSESASLSAADPSQPRIDALDLQIQDHVLDSSGFARGRIVPVTGTPAAVPVAPTLTANSERLVTFNVPAGSATATVNTGPKFVVARGGIIPVLDSSQYPTSGGRYKGLVLYDISLGALVVNTTAGSTWEPIASPASFKSVRRVQVATRTTNSATFTSEAVIATISSVPVVSGATYRLTWVVDVSSTVLGDTARWRIRDTNIAGATLQLNHTYMSMANNDFGAIITADWTAPSTGTKTFVGTCHRALGTGTFSCNANASEPSHFTVDYVSG